MWLKRFFILLVLAVLAGGGYYYFSGQNEKQVSYALARVERGDIVSTVSTTGTLNPVIIVPGGLPRCPGGSWSCWPISIPR